MNPGRLALTVVVATVADMIYGFLVYGLLLGASFDQYPAVFRPSSDMSHVGYLVLAVLFIMLAAAFIYTKGYEGRGAVPEGLRFGCVVGTLMVGVAIVNFAILNIGRRLTLLMAAAGFVEWLIMGVVIALVANPAAPVRRGARTPA
jgi:hypothetical protein